MSTTRYQLKVTLVHTNPPIWRRLEVPADLTLSQLHRVLQLAMGWEDAHLHQFECAEVRYGVPDPDFGLDLRDEHKVRLGQLMQKAGERMRYTYDFGDEWEHDIVLEQIVDGEPELNFPTVLDGERDCPPEDVGGAPGFEDFLAALQDPAHPNHREMVDWWGGPFEAEAFDRDAVNEALVAAFVPPHRRGGRRAGPRRRR